MPDLQSGPGDGRRQRRRGGNDIADRVTELDGRLLQFLDRAFVDRLLERVPVSFQSFCRLHLGTVLEAVDLACGSIGQGKGQPSLFCRQLLSFCFLEGSLGVRIGTPRHRLHIGPARHRNFRWRRPDFLAAKQLAGLNLFPIPDRVGPV